MPLAQDFHDPLKLCGRDDTPGRIAGRVEDNQTGSRRNRALDLLGRELEIRLFGLDIDGSGASENGDLWKRHPVGLGDQNFVAGINEGNTA